MDIRQPVPATFEGIDAMPEEVRYLYVQLLDEQAQREYADHGLERDKERSAAEAKEAIKANLRRNQEAFEEVRREREEAEIGGQLTADAEAFMTLRLKPKISEAHEYEPVVRTPIVQNLFFKNSLTWVAGESGTFKSFVTADLAFRYGVGDMDYHGRRMTNGRALLVVAEGAAGYADRKAAWEKEHGREVKNVSIYPAPLQLGDTLKEMPALIGYLREEEEAGRPYDLVVFDTQAMCTVGVDENTSEMNKVINVLHRIREVNGACVLVVHHFGKQKSAGMRGSSMIYAAADTVCVLKRKEDEITVKLSTAQADGGKQKDAITEKDFLELDMRSHPVGEDYFGDPVFSLVPVALEGGSHDVRDEADIDTPTELPAVTERQMLHLKALSFYEGKTTSPSGLADLMNEEAGHKIVARNSVRNTLIALSKLGLATETGKAQWTITPTGGAVIMRELSERQRVGEGWVERKGRAHRGRGPSEADQPLETQEE